MRIRGFAAGVCRAPMGRAADGEQVHPGGPRRHPPLTKRHHIYDADLMSVSRLLLGERATSCAETRAGSHAETPAFRRWGSVGACRRDQGRARIGPGYGVLRAGAARSVSAGHDARLAAPASRSRAASPASPRAVAPTRAMRAVRRGGVRPDRDFGGTTCLEVPHLLRGIESGRARGRSGIGRTDEPQTF
jgi:hypothetical protein